MPVFDHHPWLAAPGHCMRHFYEPVPQGWKVTEFNIYVSADFSLVSAFHYKITCDL